MGSSGNWCLIESDPGVFTELIRDFGCTGVEMAELYSIDEDAFLDLGNVHALVFLFKWLPGDEPAGTVVQDSRLDTIFFAQQVIQNACATQAIVNVLLNIKDKEVKLGSILNDFKSFTTGFDAADKGLCLSNSDQIRQVHNSFGRQHLFEMDQRSKGDDDVFHFIAYMPIDGRVYELDGLRPGPIDLGPIQGSDWLAVARPVIDKRIQKYSAGEIHFNLMAVINDKTLQYEKRLRELSESGVDCDNIAEEVYHLQTLIEDQNNKWDRVRKENVRRRHNYMPFIVELLKILAEQGKLVPLVKQAKEKAKQKASAEKGKAEAT